MNALKQKWILTLFAFAGLTLTSPAAEEGFQSLFNGKDLSGWEGNLGFWFVRDGVIVGQTTWATPLKSNTFLVWKGGDVKNFELRASFQLIPNNDTGFANSGIQYRSKILDRANWVVGGYQADMDFAGKYVGMLYEEKGRGIIMEPGQSIRVKDGLDAAGKPQVEVLGRPTSADDLKAAYKKAEWNEFVVIANGNHLQHFLNGKLVADVIDLDGTRGAQSGVLALQLHAGQPMTIQFKDIRMKVLP